MQVYGTVVVQAEDEYKALTKFDEVGYAVGTVFDDVDDMEITKFDYNYTTLQRSDNYAQIVCD
jgi:DUF971 family protein